MNILQKKCECILKEKTDVLSEKAKSYIDAFTADVSLPFDNNGIKIDFNPFSVFTSASTNFGLLGGLLVAYWGSAYTLYISSMFGPVSIAIGLLLSTGLSVVKLFGSGWQRSVARKIVDTFEKEKFAEKYQKSINEYWKKTSDAFDAAAEKLEQDWNNYINNLKEVINSHDINDIQNKIEILKNIIRFFENFPF